MNNKFDFFETFARKSVLALGFFILFFSLIYLPQVKKREFIKTKREQQENYENAIDEVKNSYQAGSLISLVDSIQEYNNFIKLIYDIILDPDIEVDIKKRLESAALFRKVTNTKQIMTMHPEEKNYDFKINLIKEDIEFKNLNRTMKKVIEFNAEYVASRSLPKNVEFCFFIIHGNPESIGEQFPRITNLRNGKIYSKEDIIISALGTRTSFSPLQKISIKVDREDFEDKYLNIKIEFPTYEQVIPISIDEIHSHRFQNGIDKISLSFQFEQPTFLSVCHVDMRFLKAMPIMPDEYNIKILEIDGNKKTGFLRYSVEMNDINNPVFTTFVLY